MFVIFRMPIFIHQNINYSNTTKFRYILHNLTAIEKPKNNDRF